ncbi:MAG: RuvA C-terminal domain-containing protein, partial [Alphaproteobacteria bacterium]|nr:RuvA C-terminal domain-containing protein [Alphaproteobacteria bacterium]
ALGYKSAEAGRMLKKIDTEGLDTAQIVREALRGPDKPKRRKRAD